MAKNTSDIEDKAAVAAGVAALGCLSLIVLLRLAICAAVLFGIVELGLFIARQ
jgi:hypothetical protein